MAGRKLGAFLALVFLLLNVLFVTLYHKEFNAVNVLSDDFVRETQENLTSRGVAVSQSAIDKNIPEDNIYVFETEDVQTHAEKTAQNIASALFKGKNVHTICFETPDGVSVGIYDGDNDDAELARLVMTGESFGISFVGSSFDKDSVTENNDGNDVRLGYDEKKKLEGFVNSVNVANKSGKTGFSVDKAVQTDDGIVVTVSQKIKNKKLQDCEMKVLMFNGEILYADGSWITYNVLESYHNTLIDGVNVLFQLPLDEIDTVKSEEIVYSARRAKENYYYVLPCWKINCIGKNGTNSYYFDAVEN